MPGPKSMFLFVEEKILILGPSSFRPVGTNRLDYTGWEKA